MSWPAYPEYKDSGFPWFGQVPTHWSVTRLKWQLRRNDGGVWGEDPVDEAAVPILRSTDQTVDGRWRIVEPAMRALTPKEVAIAKLGTGDLLVTKSSGSSLHIGKTTLVTENIAAEGYCYSNFMQRLRAADELLPEIIWYVMNTPLGRRQLDVLSNSTTGLANLNGSIIGGLAVPVAPKEEQQRISEFLNHETTRIDALIEEQQRLIDLLQEKRQAIIAHAVTKGLDTDVPMKDSGVEWLGEVPAHWDVTRLKWQLTRNDGGVWGEDPVDGTAVPVLRSTDQTVNGHWRISDPAMRALTEDEVSSTTLRTGDLLVTKSSGSVRHIGKTTLVTEYIEKNGYCYSNFMQRLRTAGNLRSEIIWYVMNTAFGRKQLDLLSNSTTGLANLNGTIIGELVIPVAPIVEQHKIISFLDRETARIGDLIDAANRAVGLLYERRSALISAIVTGKIDVRDWKPQNTCVEHSLLQAAETGAPYG